jgi:hypothetical protein
MKAFVFSAADNQVGKEVLCYKASRQSHKRKTESGLWHTDVELFILSALGAFRRYPF